MVAYRAKHLIQLQWFQRFQGKVQLFVNFQLSVNLWNRASQILLNRNLWKLVGSFSDTRGRTSYTTELTSCKNYDFPYWLTHSSPMHLFSTPWKHQKTWFSDVFREQRKGALGTNGLKKVDWYLYLSFIIEKCAKMLQESSGSSGLT